MQKSDGQARAQPSIINHDVGVSTQAPACSSQDQPASHKLAMLAFDPEHPSPHANALVVDMDTCCGKPYTNGSFYKWDQILQCDTIALCLPDKRKRDRRPGIAISPPTP